jgi:hypothetical protein
MSDVLQRALDARVPPRRILPRHPRHQPPNLGQNRATAPLRPRIRPLPSDELPMPPQQGVRRHDRGDGSQPLTAEAVRSHGQPATRPRSAAVVGPAVGHEARDSLQGDSEGRRVPGDSATRRERRAGAEGRDIHHGPESISPGSGFVVDWLSIQRWDITGFRRMACRASSSSRRGDVVRRVASEPACWRTSHVGVAVLSKTVDENLNEYAEQARQGAPAISTISSPASRRHDTSRCSYS